VRTLLARMPNLDLKTLRGLGIAFVLFGGLGAVLLVAAPALGLQGQAGVQRWLALVHGPWALPMAVAAFAILAFLGAPQFVMIGAAAVVFGPWNGALYSWIGTLVSALVGFELGRAFGGGIIADLNSRTVDKVLALVGRNGFMATLMVRLAPAAPFIVVNMAAGVARVRRGAFALGTAIGITPKILLIAFTGGALTGAMRGDEIQIGLLLFAIALWVGAAFFARRWMRAREAVEGWSEVERKG